MGPHWAELATCRSYAWISYCQVLFLETTDDYKPQEAFRKPGCVKATVHGQRESEYGV